MANLVNSDATLQNVLTYLGTSLFLNADLCLFQSTMPSFDNTTPLATFLDNEAAFIGYSRTVPIWGSPVYVGPYWQMTAPMQTFTSTDATPETIAGWFLINPGAGVLWAAELFPALIVVVSGSASINITPQYNSQSI